MSGGDGGGMGVVRLPVGRAGSLSRVPSASRSGTRTAMDTTASHQNGKRSQRLSIKI